MAASQVRNIACLLHDMVQEYAAKTSALRRLVHRNLPEEQHRQLAMTRCPTRAAMKFLYIHHAQVDRMVAENSRTPLFDNDIDTSHVVLLLFPCAELEVVAEANNTAVEVSAVMPRRIETLDSEGLLLHRLNRHQQRAADSSEPHPRRAEWELGACQGRQQTAQHRPETRRAETVLRARG